MYACVFYRMPEELENELNFEDDDYLVTFPPDQPKKKYSIFYEQILPIIAAGLFTTLIVFGAFAISGYLNGAGAEAPTPNIGITSSYIYPTEGPLAIEIWYGVTFQIPDTYTQSRVMLEWSKDKINWYVAEEDCENQNRVHRANGKTTFPAPGIYYARIAYLNPSGVYHSEIMNYTAY